MCVVKRKYETERHIAALKYNNRKMLEAKWKPVRNVIVILLL